MSLSLSRQSNKSGCFTLIKRAPCAALGPACRPAHRSEAQKVAATVEGDSAPLTLREEYLEDYEKLKKGLMDNARKSGAAVAAYMLLTVDGEASLCASFGAIFGYAYLQWLFFDVDNIKPNDMVVLVEAKKIQSPLLRRLAMWFASYTHALRPRLLVPVALAMLMTLYNRTAPVPLDGLYEACILLGFLSYKGALFTEVASSLTVKESEYDMPSRPALMKIEDEFDMWGRPKNQVVKMPTEVLPEDTDPDDLPIIPFLKDMAKEEEQAFLQESEDRR